MHYKLPKLINYAYQDMYKHNYNNDVLILNYISEKQMKAIEKVIYEVNLTVFFVSTVSTT